MADVNGYPMGAEERLAVYESLREDAATSTGWTVEGYNPYAGDWDFDFSWPDCPDSLQAPVMQASLVVGKPDKRGRLKASSLRRVQLGGEDVRKLREASGFDRRIQEWGNTDPFAYDLSQQPVQAGGVLGQYVPLWPGPVTRQLYWQDYWQMSAKSFEAYNHDPVSWRCVHMKGEFALGRGLQSKVTVAKGTRSGQTHEKGTVAWEEFWQRNKMDERLDKLSRDFCWSGEQFLRYFKKGKLLTVRSLDPASIYDLITDPEDIETVFAYHQQFQTAYQLYPPKTGSPPGDAIPSPTGPSQPGASVRYIIRQILPQEIDHYKINASAYERRGRSDLFPGLGWIKRLRDYLTSHVIQADMMSRVCWDLEVQGNVAAIQALRGQLFPGGRPPQPGTVFGHNQTAKLTAIAPQRAAGSTRGDPILDALVTMVAGSIGLPKDWLGFGMQNTRAGALVATEPASKSLEELQGTLEAIIHDAFNRVMTAAGITDAELEVTFPSIASEDRTQKLQDLSFAEANNWISKQTAGAIAAKELGISTYNFEEELKLIAQEFPEAEMEDVPDAQPDPLTGKKPQRPKQGDGTVRRSVIIASNRQSAKLDITKSTPAEDEPPGLLVPTDGSPLPTAAGQPPPNGGSPVPQPKAKPGDSTPTRGGMPSDENPLAAAGAKNLKKDLSETEQVFTFSASQLAWLLMRERQGARRRPDDPEYLAQAQRYREQSAQNLQKLVNSAKQGAPDG